MKNRSKDDIIAEILSSAAQEIQKTKILTKVNLTSNQLRNYIDLLSDNNLILQYRRQDGVLCYRTTEKGLGFVSLYNHMQNLTPGLRENKKTRRSFDFFGYL